MAVRNRTRSVRDRVRYAARQLDQVRPGWEKEIDVGRLNILCPEDCIAGQLVGHFGNYDMLGIKGSSASNGMQATAEDGYARQGEYALLTTAWQRLIVKRTGGAMPPARVPTFFERISLRFLSAFPSFA